MGYPSTFLDIQNAVIDKLRLDAAADRERVKDWINQVYADVCVETAANITAANLTLTADEPTYTLPDSVLKITDMYVTPVDGTTYGPLEPVALSQIIRWRQGTGGNTSSGSVLYYCRRGLNLIDFYPTPSSADTITVYYVVLPAVLSEDEDVADLQEPWSSKLLEYGALAEAADFKRDPSEGQYRALYADWLRRFQTHMNMSGGGVAKQIPVFNAFDRMPADNSMDAR